MWSPKVQRFQEPKRWAVTVLKKTEALYCICLSFCMQQILAAGNGALGFPTGMHSRRHLLSFWPQMLLIFWGLTRSCTHLEARGWCDVHHVSAFTVKGEGNAFVYQLFPHPSQANPTFRCLFFFLHPVFFLAWCHPLILCGWQLWKSNGCYGMAPYGCYFGTLLRVVALYLCSSPCWKGGKMLRTVSFCLSLTLFEE